MLTSSVSVSNANTIGGRMTTTSSNRFTLPTSRAHSNPLSSMCTSTTLTTVQLLPDLGCGRWAAAHGYGCMGGSMVLRHGSYSMEPNVNGTPRLNLGMATYMLPSWPIAILVGTTFRATYSPDSVARNRSPGSVHLRCAPLTMKATRSTDTPIPVAGRFSSTAAATVTKNICQKNDIVIIIICYH